MTPRWLLAVRHRAAKAAAKAAQAARPACLPEMTHRWVCGDPEQTVVRARCRNCGQETTFSVPQIDYMPDFNGRTNTGQVPRLLRRMLEEREVE